MVNHPSAYIEDDLRLVKRSAFQARLRKCRTYQAFVEALSSTIGALGKLRGISAPSVLKQSLLDRMHQEN